jgi:hypothetical protein
MLQFSHAQKTCYSFFKIVLMQVIFCYFKLFHLKLLYGILSSANSKLFKII